MHIIIFLDGMTRSSNKKDIDVIEKEKINSIITTTAIRDEESVSKEVEKHQRPLNDSLIGNAL